MPQPFADAMSWVPKTRALAATLARAHDFARAHGHGSVGLEHLLLSLIEDADAAGVLEASNVALEDLSADVATYLGTLPVEESAVPEAGEALLRILEYAVAAAQQSRRRDVNGGIVLAAIVGEGKSEAATLLRNHGMTFAAAIEAIRGGTRSTTAGQGIVPAPERPTAPDRPTAPSPAGPPPNEAVHDAASETTEEILARARRRVEALQTPAPPPPGPRPAPAAVTEADEEPGPPPPSRLPAPEPSVPEAPPEPAAPADAWPDETSATAHQAFAEEALPPPLPPPPTPADEPPPVPPPAPSSWLPPGPPPAPVTHPARVPPPMPPLAEPPASERWPAAVDMPPPPPPRAPEPAGSPHAAPWTDAPPLSAQQERRPPPPPVPSFDHAMDPGSHEQSAAGQPRRRRRRGQQRPEMSPGAAVAHIFDQERFAAALPRRATVGTPFIVEIGLDRSEIATLATLGEPPATSLTLRLGIGSGKAHIEIGPPETIWLDAASGVYGEDSAVWRWTVVPQRSGRLKLHVAGALRTLDGNGHPVETAIPDQTLELRVARNYWSLLRQIVVVSLVAGAAAFLDDRAEPLLDQLIEAIGTFVGK